MREFQFILSKQVLIVFLALLVTAWALLGVPLATRTLAESPPPLLQAGSGDGWTLVPTTSLSPSAPTVRNNHAMAATPSGDVLLFGGWNGSYLNDTWLFNTATNCWSQVSTSPTPTARYGHTMATTPAGVLLFGGYDGSNLNDTWLFNTADNTWSLLTGSPSTPTARYLHAMAATPSGNVLLFGGWNGSFLNDTWLFNTAANTWSLLTGSSSTSPAAHATHAMAATPSGVLLFGGYDGSFLNDTWLFNTATNSWFQVSTSPAPPVRYGHAMATTPVGDVLLFGGYDGSNLNDTWLFNTVTNTWGQITSSPSNPTARRIHTMATTPSGVLLFGGYDGDFLNDTWLYGPVTSTVTLHLQTGWNLASVPAVTDGSPNTVFAGLPAGWYLFSWDGFHNRYTSKEDTVLHVGAGFWLRVTEAVDYNVATTPYTPNSLQIALANGWNIVGTPYPVRCDWTTVQFLYFGTTYALDQAITNGWMGASIIVWTGTEYGNAKPWFAPTYGYWIRSLVNGASLVFHRPP